MSERKVWGVYDNRDYYVSTLHDDKLYTDEAEAQRICDAMNEQEGYGFSVEDHVLVDPPASRDNLAKED
jgi:hypothetical protein